MDIDRMAADFEKNRVKLQEDISPADFLAMIKELKRISPLAQHLSNYAEMITHIGY